MSSSLPPPVLRASTEDEARMKLRALPHRCGDRTFAPALRRSHDEQGLWFVFGGPCPGCGQDREVRFFARAPGDDFAALGGGREEAELYGAAPGPCSACGGAGEYLGVTGDYATGMVTCGHCRGTGVAR